MASVEQSRGSGGAPVDFKLEVVVLGVEDVERSKAFYQGLGWRLDGDFAGGEFHAVQVTPHNSGCSVIFGKGIPAPKPGSAVSLVLAVSDIEAARADLISRGVQASEVFRFGGGPFNETVEPTRIPGRDPEGRSYYSFVSFEDPDGNGWLLQEIQTRLAGREWQPDVPALAALLRETGEHHDGYEKTHAEHQWSDWYAAYLSARQGGGTPDEATASANGYMDNVLHVPAR
jgi:catechol 2,3-dioxygenase-like lactoylglutathione lyase family enzyme